MVLNLGDFGRDFRLRNFQCARHIAHARIERLHEGHGIKAGDRFDAPHTCSNATLTDNLKKADVASAGHMRAAAKFFATADF